MQEKMTEHEQRAMLPWHGTRLLVLAHFFLPWRSGLLTTRSYEQTHSLAVRNLPDDPSGDLNFTSPTRAVFLRLFLPIMTEDTGHPGQDAPFPCSVHHDYGEPRVCGSVRVPGPKPHA